MNRQALKTGIKITGEARQWNGRRAVVISLIFHCAILALVLLGGVPGEVRAQSQTEEYRVKAAFLFHFAQLVDWPSGAFGSDSTPFTVCITGEDPFRGDLANTLNGKLIDSRSIRVLHLTQPREARSCQIFFIGTSEEKQIPAILAELGNAPVLTVGETESFIDRGGMICFSIDDSKVRFEINLGTAQKSGLKISSRLLQLAKRVVQQHE